MAREDHERLLAELKVGSSFFLEGVKPQQMGYVRRMGYKLGISLSIRQVMEDEIYGRMGVRVKRLK